LERMTAAELPPVKGYARIPCKANNLHLLGNKKITFGEINCLHGWG